MGIRTYRIVTQREILVKARNKTEVKEMIEAGKIPIYEDETIVEFKERLPNQPVLTVRPVYTPKAVLKRNKQENKEDKQENKEVAQPEGNVTSDVTEAVNENKDLPNNVVPFPVSGNN